ncbi:DUF2306 domain-containing protein [Paenibacillus sp. TRM 82003]|nr:DUF2306 domain-containing protein [Paenibacillus sp. TRM 82003]
MRIRGLFGFFLVGYVLYVLALHFYIDPTSSAFLKEKVNLTRELNEQVWLIVVKVHVVAACLAIVAGGFNLLTAVHPKIGSYHKLSGYLYVISVCTVILTSGYLAPYSTGGRLNSIVFNIMNIVWLGVTMLSIMAIKRGSVQKHRFWMIRSYIFCSTNFMIHFIAFLTSKILNMDYVQSYTVGVYGAFILNLGLPFVMRLREDLITIRTKVIEKS